MIKEPREARRVTGYLNDFDLNICIGPINVEAEEEAEVEAEEEDDDTRTFT